MSECFICRKHTELKSYVGEPVAERGGLLAAHFPFLPDEKATRGHLIIEPRRHIVDLSEMNEAEAGALGGLIRDASHAIKTVLGAEHVYLFRINDKVAHLHFHLVPRYPNTPREFWGQNLMSWPERQTVTLPEIQDLARRLKL